MSERRNLVIAIVVAFVFGIAGGVVGTLGTIALTHHGRPPFGDSDRIGRDGPGRGERGERGAPRGRRGGGRPGMERVLDRQLDLSDDQRVRIEAILDAARPRYAAMRESTRVEINRVLTPEQRTKLKEMEDRFPERRGNRAGR